MKEEFTCQGVSPNVTISYKGKTLNIGEVVKILNLQNELNKKLSDENKEFKKQVEVLIDEKIMDYEEYYTVQYEDQNYSLAESMKEVVNALKDLRKEIF